MQNVVQYWVCPRWSSERHSPTPQRRYSYSISLYSSSYLLCLTDWGVGGTRQTGGSGRTGVSSFRESIAARPPFGPMEGRGLSRARIF